MLFRDRRDAGRQLATRLSHFARRSDVIVLGLPRGGVTVAFEVADALDVPLDVLVVRKLGVPEQEELAMGAIASGGIRVLNEELIRELNVPPAEAEAVAEQEMTEIRRRERLFRDGFEPLEIEGKTVIIVDDGLATGATARAAIRAVSVKRPKRIVVAVPVTSRSARFSVAMDADEVIALATPDDFTSVGEWYSDFTPVFDEDVRTILREARSRVYA